MPFRLPFPFYPSRLWAGGKLKRALQNYSEYSPPYSPPHRTAERHLPYEKALENFEYFMSVRLERIDRLAAWLSSEFGVKTNSGKVELEQGLRWAERYFGFLLPDDYRDLELVFFDYDKPWTGEWAGLNVIVDFAAYLGEQIIARRPQLQWKMEWSLADYPGIEEKVGRNLLHELKSRQRDFNKEKLISFGFFRKPVLTSGADPIEFAEVLPPAYSYACSMQSEIKLRGVFPFDRSSNSGNLRRQVTDAVTNRTSYLASIKD